jgi:hypothetical protein
MEDDRRSRSRMPLKLILASVLVVSAIWLLELYMDPTWAKIRSFVLGYFVGTFIQEWVHQRSSRGTVMAAAPPSS